MLNKTINGYTIKRPLGKGGMAEVWYAENKIDKPAAVKILNPDLSLNAPIVERFLNEAKIMVKLTHPNIRQVYDYDEIEGRPCIIMEYLEGDDLKAIVKKRGALDSGTAANYWNQIVAALNYTHGKGVVHRDIKPSNIFVTDEGQVKLLDFGIAKVRDAVTGTQTGQKLGTLVYMSPEQITDSKHVDNRTDIYSLAVTFVHLLTGRVPYDTDSSSDYAIMDQIVKHPLNMAGVPSEWQAFLMPYLEKEPGKRPVLREFSVQSPAPKDVTDRTFIESPAPQKPSELSNPPQKPVVETTPIKPSPLPSSEPRKRKALPWIISGAVVTVIVAVILTTTLKNKPSNNQDDLNVSSVVLPDDLSRIKVVMPDGDAGEYVFDGIPLKIVFVQGGTFQMGATSEQGSDTDPDEEPVHSVTVSDFCIGETEVTQALYRVIMGKDPKYSYEPDYDKGDSYPAYRVSWTDCQEFIERLNLLTGKIFRLPTEAEWEYAARGGNKSRGHKYAGSNKIVDVAWYGGNQYTGDKGTSKGHVHPVKMKLPNELGLYDMSGNVWEWCQDRFEDHYYSVSPSINPTGPPSGDVRVLRGGSCHNPDWGCRVAIRNYNWPKYRDYISGFRVVLVHQ